jgi:hypothetical protein
MYQNGLSKISLSRKLRVDQIFHLLRQNGKFFSVTFNRRTNSSTAKAGDEVKILCRTGVNKYSSGALPAGYRDEEDSRTGTLTVWSMTHYMKYRASGLDIVAAGKKSYRRIDVCSITMCSVVHTGNLPPIIKEEWHKITNIYRKQNMPKTQRSND